MATTEKAGCGRLGLNFWEILTTVTGGSQPSETKMKQLPPCFTQNSPNPFGNSSPSAPPRKRDSSQSFERLSSPVNVGSTNGHWAASGCARLAPSVSLTPLRHGGRGEAPGARGFGQATVTVWLRKLVRDPDQQPEAREPKEPAAAGSHPQAGTQGGTGRKPRPRAADPSDGTSLKSIAPTSCSKHTLSEPCKQFSAGTKNSRVRPGFQICTMQ